MEPVGLALGAIAFLETVLRTYDKASTLIKDTRAFGDDRDKIIAKLTAEKAITLRLRDLIFNRGPDESETPLFEQLDSSTQNSLHLIFGEFAKTIAEYLPLDGRYNLSSAAPQQANLTEPMQQLVLVSNSNQLIPAPSLPSGSRTKPLRWAFKDKKRLTEFHTEFELWNKKITQLIELYLLRQQARGAVGIVSTKTTELGQLGVADALAAASKAQPILATTPSIHAAKIEDFQRPWMELKESQKIAAHSLFERGKFEDDFVIVDSRNKNGVLSQDQQTTVSKRLNQLVSILQNLHRMEPAVPRCMCWIERPDKGDSSLLFQIPSDLEPRPMSLYDYLPKESLTKGPSLEERFLIAYQLASALDRFHSVNWVHKSLRSDSILFYHPKNRQGANAVEGRVLPEKWFVYGYDFARPLDQKSSISADTNLTRNVYRHPQRWGVPTESFSPIHDIYALGVVLLELGIWRKAPSLLRPSIQESNDPFQISGALAGRAKSHLGYSAGLRYRDLTLRCLLGTFGEWNTPGMQLDAAFRSYVVDELRLLAYPSVAAGQRLQMDDWLIDEASDDGE
jgi:hypothetical protein